MSERTQGRESKGFLDGDLIEAFLDLRRDKMEEVCIWIRRREEVNDVDAGEISWQGGLVRIPLDPENVCLAWCV